MTTGSQVLDDLNALGTAQEVADYLRAKGIKGKRRNSCYCPVAMVLHAEGVLRNVVVTRTIIIADSSPLYRNCYDMSETVSEFIDLFDSAMFPDLEGEPTTHG